MAEKATAAVGPPLALAGRNAGREGLAATRTIGPYGNPSGAARHLPLVTKGRLWLAQPQASCQPLQTSTHRVVWA